MKKKKEKEKLKYCLVLVFTQVSRVDQSSRGRFDRCWFLDFWSITAFSRFKPWMISWVDRFVLKTFKPAKLNELTRQVVWSNVRINCFFITVDCELPWFFWRITESEGSSLSLPKNVCQFLLKHIKIKLVTFVELHESILNQKAYVENIFDRVWKRLGVNNEVIERNWLFVISLIFLSEDVPYVLHMFSHLGILVFICYVSQLLWLNSLWSCLYFEVNDNQFDYSGRLSVLPDLFVWAVVVCVLWEVLLVCEALWFQVGVWEECTG